MHRYETRLPLSGAPYRSLAVTPLGRIAYGGHHLNVRAGPMRTRRWDTYSLVYVRSGSAVFHSQSVADQAVGEGDLMLMFPRHAYRYLIGSETTWSETFIQFDGPLFDLCRKRGLLTPADPVWRLPAAGAWRARLDAIVAPGSAADAAAALHRVGLMLSFLTDAWTAAHRPGVEPADREWLAAAETLLERDLAAYPDWEALGRGLGLSYERFRKRFRELAGQSPAKFRADRRIAWAAGLLEAGADSVEAIARTCGYHDKFHFMKRFKAATGLTPAQYRLRGH